MFEGCLLLTPNILHVVYIYIIKKYIFIDCNRQYALRRLSSDPHNISQPCQATKKIFQNTSSHLTSNTSRCFGGLYLRAGGTLNLGILEALNKLNNLFTAIRITILPLSTTIMIMNSRLIMKVFVPKSMKV